MSQLKKGIIFLQLFLLIGTTGYMAIEKWSFGDALYMTIIAMTTTGFNEVHPLTPAGRIFTVAIIILGVSSLAYIGGRAAQLFIESKILRRRRVSKKLDELNDHYIVCGYGRIGKTICQELAAVKASFVVIEKDAEKLNELYECSFLFVQGDATHDDFLLRAGIKRAKGLVAALATDSDNVYLTLSAKELNPKVFLVTRAIEEETEKKLIRAGADRVVHPYEIGAHRMVHLLVRPGVVDFIDIVAREKDIDLNLEEIMVSENSQLHNKTLAESLIRQKLNVIIVAIFRKDGEFTYNPKSTSKIQIGDRLIAIGQLKDLVKLNDFCV